MEDCRPTEANTVPENSWENFFPLPQLLGPEEAGDAEGNGKPHHFHKGEAHPGGGDGRRQPRRTGQEEASPPGMAPYRKLQVKGSSVI